LNTRQSRGWQTLSTIFGSGQSKAGGIIILGLFILIGAGTFLVPYSPTTFTDQLNAAPSFLHPFGTDFIGHDLLAQVVWGAFPSLLTSIYVSLIATVLGFFVGVNAGYFKKLEPVLAGATDIIMTFPPLPILIIIGTIFLGNDQLTAIALIVVIWAPVARAVRSQTSSVKRRGYINTAKVAGMGGKNIVWRIIAPTVAPVAFAYFIINLSLALIYITALEFLGVGNPLLVSWGSILYWASQDAFTNGDWWWVLFPGLIIVLTTTAFALLGYGLEELTNPRLRS
jgi:peptide/nickel transport system permease protein